MGIGQSVKSGAVIMGLEGYTDNEKALNKYTALAMVDEYNRTKMLQESLFRYDRALVTPEKGYEWIGDGMTLGGTLPLTPQELKYEYTGIVNPDANTVKTTYNIGESLETTFRGVITLHNGRGDITRNVLPSDGLTRTIPDMSTSGTKRVTVSYTLNNVTHSYFYDITITNPSIIDDTTAYNGFGDVRYGSAKPWIKYRDIPNGLYDIEVAGASGGGGSSSAGDNTNCNGGLTKLFRIRLNGQAKWGVGGAAGRGLRTDYVDPMGGGGSAFRCGNVIVIAGGGAGGVDEDFGGGTSRLSSGWASGGGYGGDGCRVNGTSEAARARGRAPLDGNSGVDERDVGNGGYRCNPGGIDEVYCFGKSSGNENSSSVTYYSNTHQFKGRPQNASSYAHIGADADYNDKPEIGKMGGGAYSLDGGQKWKFTPGNVRSTPHQGGPATEGSGTSSSGAQIVIGGGGKNDNNGATFSSTDGFVFKTDNAGQDGWVKVTRVGD